MRMAWSDWRPLIQEFVNHWTAFGAGTSVAGKTLVEFQTTADALEAAIDTCTSLEHQLELAARTRDIAAEAAYAAMKSYTDGIKAMEGRDSAQATTLPRLTRRRRSSSGGGGAPQPPTV